MEQKREAAAHVKDVDAELKQYPQFWERMHSDAAELGLAFAPGIGPARFIPSNELHLFRSLTVPGEPHAVKVYPMVWRQLSGLMHADVTAVLRAGEVKCGETVLHGSIATLTLDDVEMGTALFVVAELQRVAIELLATRSCKPQGA